MSMRIVCGVDFSESSRAALGLASILAERFQARLTAATIEHPLLASLAEGGSGRPDLDVGQMLRHLVAEILTDRASKIGIDYVVGVGQPADELLRIAREQQAELIVMSSHGLTGVRKLFFGSTTERLLRESDIPVLVTAPGSCTPGSWGEMRAAVNRVLIPVDLLAGTESQVSEALHVADMLGTESVVTHVIEPMRLPLMRHEEGIRIDTQRRAAAERALDAILASTSGTRRPERVAAYGDPAEQIAEVARERSAGLIVMGSRTGGAPRFRLGSVTYRVLCISHLTVLALPPDARRSLALAAVREGTETASA